MKFPRIVAEVLAVPEVIINHMKGKFITIYGINNIGKTTQSKLLVKKLKKAGYNAVYIKYPIYDISPTGPFLNEVLRGKKAQEISEDELQSWFVLNRYQFQPELKKLLNKGMIVISEDYIGTGIAWGTAKGLEVDWLEEINKHLIKEDFAILMEGQRDLNVKEKNHVHEQNDKLVEKCRKVHSDLAKKYGWRKITMQKEINKTSEMIFKTVLDYLNRY